MQEVRRFLFLEAAAFVLVALVHAGVLTAGREPAATRAAGAVIAVVLLAGALLGFGRPAWARRAAIAAQDFVLLGVGVGLFTIAVGVGSRTGSDVIHHLAIVAVLA